MVSLLLNNLNDKYFYNFILEMYYHHFFDLSFYIFLIYNIYQINI